MIIRDRTVIFEHLADHRHHGNVLAFVLPEGIDMRKLSESCHGVCKSESKRLATMLGKPAKEQ